MKNSPEFTIKTAFGELHVHATGTDASKDDVSIMVDVIREGKPAESIAIMQCDGVDGVFTSLFHIEEEMPEVEFFHVIDNKPYDVCYYIEDEIVETHQVNGLEMALEEASAFECQAFQELETSEDISLFVGVKDPETGSFMLWENTDGERGTDCDESDPRFRNIRPYLEWKF